ncbi:MAG: hypothetical protein KJ879_03305 [Nanoarchaeota archaeon]|nr:hypothetical protein [Nanoarchaeota archaeon]
MNKRGQGLSTNAIILIILGVIVLVVLILGFTIGWAKLFPFIQSNNVQNIVTSCETACTTGAQFDWCSAQRNLNDGTSKETDDCQGFATDLKYSGRNYGINTCPSITCASAPTTP